MSENKYVVVNLEWLNAIIDCGNFLCPSGVGECPTDENGIAIECGDCWLQSEADEVREITSNQLAERMKKFIEGIRLPHEECQKGGSADPCSATDDCITEWCPACQIKAITKNAVALLADIQKEGKCE